MIDDEIITHRIIEINGEDILTQGDANSGKDKLINKTNVIGKVVKIIPKLGIWINVFTDIKVIIPITITIVLFGLAISSEKSPKENQSFSRFMRKRRKRKK